ncbi:MAG: hypothetical protein H0W89_06095 [Candidatus Levybacteria bacterium]|nr:hypothetical protein [Candidatus Levybacteria bacterium]
MVIPEESGADHQDGSLAEQFTAPAAHAERESISAPPIYFGGGFGYGESRNNGVLDYIKTLGHDTIPSLPDPDRRERNNNFMLRGEKGSVVLSRMQTLRLAGTMNPDTVTSHYQHERAQELILTLESGGYTGIDAIFQSGDAINGLEVLYERPDLVGNAILAYPAGIIKQPRFLKASAGVFRSAWKARPPDDISAENNFEVGDDGKKVKREFGASNFTVAASVALTDQSHMLSEIRSRPNPHGIWLVLGLQDWMVRAEDVIESLQSPNDVDGILITDKPHGISGRKDEIHEWLKLFPLMKEAKAAREAGMATATPLASRVRFFGDISQEKQDELLTLVSKVGAKSNNP